MNIHYQSPEIAQFYSKHRRAWVDFYPSERFVFERVISERGRFGSVLDVGGAVGGLGLALHEKFGLMDYTCLDINPQAIATATAARGSFPFPIQFLCDDIATRPPALKHRTFDVVVSLSCADWNTDPLQIIAACWEYVAPDGELILSLRLTNGPSVNDIEHSYQFIQFGPGDVDPTGERANYVVLNVHEALSLLGRQMPRPSRLFAYGYWGKPSRTAVTIYDRVGFTVLALRKGRDGTDTLAELSLPLDLVSRI